MNDILNNSKIHLNFFFIIFIIQSFSTSLPKLLNNIIRLGGNDSRYSHFTFNENGDMIIDTSYYPVSQERIFFGLKKMEDFILIIPMVENQHIIKLMLIIQLVELKVSPIVLK